MSAPTTPPTQPSPRARSRLNAQGERKPAKIEPQRSVLDGCAARLELVQDSGSLLFPSMARPYLRKAQPLVSAYCAAQDVPYTRTTLWQSYRIVIDYLNTVGLRGKDPFLCPMVAQRRTL